MGPPLPTTDDRHVRASQAQGAPGSGVKVAYLVNQYPAVSHSFIRREIVALEARGVTVERFSIRPPHGRYAPRSRNLRRRVPVST